MTDVPGLDVAGLAAWIDRVHPELSPEPDHDANADPEPDAPAARRADGSGITAAVIEGGRSNLTYRIEGTRRPLILRRPPLGHVLSSAHDMRREHRVISALGGSAVPVPVAVDIVDDTDTREVTGTPFFVMERAPGRVLARPADNAGFTPAALHRLGISLAAHLADLHAVDPDSVGLGDFGRPDGYLERQLRTWRRQLDASRSRETPTLDALQASLEGDVPASGRPAIVHGDYRLDNALVVGGRDDAHVSAILDWEMATLGDPLVDLGMFALYWTIGDLAGDDGDADGAANPVLAAAVPSAVDPAAGYPDLDELVDAYAARAGIAVPALNWYRAFAAYKLAVILEGIHYRFRAGDTVGAGFDRMGGLVEPLARRGLEAR